METMTKPKTRKMKMTQHEALILAIFIGFLGTIAFLGWEVIKPIGTMNLW